MARPIFRNRERAESFGSVVDNYDRFRPTYPDALIDDLVATGPQQVLDIGCGTGKAARLFAARGLDVLGVEIDPKMADMARGHGIDVELGAFEDWDAGGRTFDLLTSGQAWHWVDPVRAVPKAAQVLRPGGYAALFWNHDRIADPDLDRARADAYADLVPELLEDGPDHEGERPELRDFVADELFEPVVSRTYTWQRPMTADEWVGMCFTYSNHLLLPPERREPFAARLREIGADAGGVVIDYETYLILARRAG